MGGLGGCVRCGYWVARDRAFWARVGWVFWVERRKERREKREKGRERKDNVNPTMSRKCHINI